MKRPWPTLPLGQACVIRPPKDEARRRIGPDALVSFLPMEDLGIDEKFARATQTKRLSEVLGNYTYFSDGDVLLAKITPCFENGKLGIADALTNGVGFGSSEYVVMRPYKELTSDWLYYYLSRQTFRDEGAARMSGAVGHRRVAREFLEAYPIPVPALSEQGRITGILDRTLNDITSAIDAAVKSEHHSDDIFKSHLQRVFTQPPASWVTSTLGETTRFIDYRGKTPNKTSHGLRLITAKNVKMGYLQREPEEFVAAASYKNWMTRGIPRRGDVLFTTEAPLANIAQLDSDERVVFAQRIIVMQANSSVLDSAFLKYLLLSEPVQRRIHARGTGATAKGIKASLLKTTEVAFPSSVREQVAVVEKLDWLREESSRLAALYRRKRQRLEALRQALLHSAFSSRL